MMQKKRTITPGQRLFEYKVGGGDWERLNATSRAEYEEDAARLDIPPLTEEVPPPTDGELWQQAWASSETDADMAAEFLRLVRERDGEPLPVTGEMLDAWWRDRCVKWDDLAPIINAHRGVRPELPKVTTDMVIAAYKIPCPMDAAIYLNAELAKLAGKDGA